MLSVSPLSNTKDEREGEMEGFSIGGDEFPDFSVGNLLDSIDFDDLFVGINDGDVLPDLEMDNEILAEFSSSGGEESEMNTSVSSEKVEDNSRKEEEDKVSGSGGSSLNQGEEIVSKRDEPVEANTSPKEADKGRKSSQSKNPQGKRKVKVDWTPELHRRFVQAVEQLGVDKAVPSRILELMGIDCLTRHNIASHLQKYRSHRKHLLAREAEAASWSQRRQIYGGATGGSKRDMSPWQLAPTMGFPPMTPLHHFRPLHVWGHPTADHSIVHMWPKHLVPSPSPPPPPPPARMGTNPTSSTTTSTRPFILALTPPTCSKFSYGRNALLSTTTTGNNEICQSNGPGHSSPCHVQSRPRHWHPDRTYRSPPSV
ncbi:hypothetical protein F0562_008455 [Nyssa sinensis]|uniref:HTH myb-type domain-containing protein n=1 Tax=Nyssa sinensis TaxID=561372 RepID=A0A5J5A8W9_9ASTE|nr:hypothetical protein F0562_008455 [Nyssa sinensis]